MLVQFRSIYLNREMNAVQYFFFCPFSISSHFLPLKEHKLIPPNIQKCSVCCSLPPNPVNFPQTQH